MTAQTNELRKKAERALLERSKEFERKTLVSEARFTVGKFFDEIKKTFARERERVKIERNVTFKDRNLMYFDLENAKGTKHVNVKVFKENGWEDNPRLVYHVRLELRDWTSICNPDFKALNETKKQKCFERFDVCFSQDFNERLYLYFVNVACDLHEQPIWDAQGQILEAIYCLGVNH